MTDNLKDKKEEVKKEENVSTEIAVEKLYEAFENTFDKFDEYLAKAFENECIQEFMEGYSQLRESGFDFDDAFETAASQLDLDEEEESSDD